MPQGPESAGSIWASALYFAASRDSAVWCPSPVIPSSKSKSEDAANLKRLLLLLHDEFFLLKDMIYLQGQYRN
jgi:hypothetical protein